MAKYKLTDTTLIGGSLLAAGAEVDYAGWPGSTLAPLDDDARETKAHYDAVRKSGRDPGEWRDWRPAETASEPVVIPDDWEELRPEQIINLARRLGAPVKGTTADKAEKFIKAQIKVRRDHDAPAEEHDGAE